MTSVAYLIASFLAFGHAASSSSSSSSSARWTVRFLRSDVPIVPLCVAYVVMLVASWSPDTLSLMMPGSLEAGISDGFNPQYFPKLDGIMTLLSRRVTAASAWLHLMCINFFVGKHATIRALREGIPVWHTLALTLLTGPLGLCSHWVTRAVLRRRRGGGGGDGGGGGGGFGNGGDGGGTRRKVPYGSAYGNAYGGPADAEGAKERARRALISRLAYRRE